MSYTLVTLAGARLEFHGEEPQRRTLTLHHRTEPARMFRRQADGTFLETKSQ